MTKQLEISTPEALELAELVDVMPQDVRATMVRMAKLLIDRVRTAQPFLPLELNHRLPPN